MPVRPVDDDVVGEREPPRRGEHGPGVAHGHLVAEHLGHPHERAREVDGAEDQHPRRRHERLDEHGDVVGDGLAVGAVAADAGRARGQPALGVAGDDPVELGVAERADRAACPGARGAWPRRPGRRRRWPGRPAAPARMAAASSSTGGLGLDGLEEEVDGPAAGEPDGEGLVVAVAEGVQAAGAGRQRRQRRLDDRALDAPARDRPDDLAVVGDGHRRPGVTGPGALEVDDPSEGDPPALPARTARGRRAAHASASTSARAARASTEWPSTNSSTCGRAAAMPRASGA